MRRLKLFFLLSPLRPSFPSSRPLTSRRCRSPITTPDRAAIIRRLIHFSSVWPRWLISLHNFIWREFKHSNCSRTFVLHHYVESWVKVSERPTNAHTKYTPIPLLRFIKRSVPFFSTWRKRCMSTATYKTVNIFHLKNIHTKIKSGFFLKRFLVFWSTAIKKGHLKVKTSRTCT